MSTQIKDAQGNIIDTLNKIGGETITDARANTVVLGALNAETTIDLDGQTMANFDVRGTLSLTLTPSYSVDGSNYIDLPVFNRAIEAFALNVTVIGTYQFEIPIGAKKIRIRCTAYTSGSATVALTANMGAQLVYTKDIPLTSHVTATGVSGAAVTLTLPSVTGLRHYIRNIKIEKFAVALLVAGATPVIGTTTNLAGSRAYSFDASAQLAGVIIKERETFDGSPLMSVAVTTATTIVLPATTNVIWRVSCDYYLGL